MRIATFLIVLIALCTLLATTCSGSGGPQPASTPEPAATWPVQTGIAPVDEFLNLMAADDIQTIAGRTAFRPIECEPDLLMQDAPLYCDELPAGVTVVDGISVGCLPYNWVISRDDMPEALDWLLDDRTLEALHEIDWPDAEYALVFVRTAAPPAPAVNRTVVYLTEDGW